MSERFGTGLRGESLPDDFSPAVWDAWNAKSARAKPKTRLSPTAASRRVSALPPTTVGLRFEQWARCGSTSAAVGAELNEHMFHTWDVEVRDMLSE